MNSYEWAEPIFRLLRFLPISALYSSLDKIDITPTSSYGTISNNNSFICNGIAYLNFTYAPTITTGSFSDIPAPLKDTTLTFCSDQGSKSRVGSIQKNNTSCDGLTLISGEKYAVNAVYPVA